jgi:hypothetical protein
VESPLEIRWQVRMMNRVLTSGVPSPTQPFLVLGSAELFGDVLPLYDEADASMSSRHFPVLMGGNTFGRPGRCVEVRAAAARLTELFVYDDGMERVWPVAEVVGLLAEAYGVPVCAGEPPYGAADWDAQLLSEHRYLQVGLAVTALIEIPQVCLLEFPTCEQRLVYRLAGAGGGSAEAIGCGVVIA